MRAAEQIIIVGGSDASGRSGGSAGPLAPYVGPASTGGVMGVEGARVGQNQVMSRSRHVAWDNLRDIQLIFAAWYVGPGTTYEETSVGSAVDVTASVEFGDGTIQQITFSGIAQGSMLDGGTLTSDLVTLNKTIARGTVFWIRNWQNMPTGLVSQSNADNSLGEGGAGGVTTTDKTLSGTVGTSAGASFRRPAAVLSTTTYPTFGVIGDSRVEGIGGTTLATGWYGEILPTLSDRYGWVAAHRQGSAMATYASAGVKSVPIINKASHILLELGINDENNTTLAGVKTRQAAIWAMFPGKTRVATTHAGYTSSVNGYIAPDDQAVVSAAQNTIRKDANDWRRSGAENTIDGYFEIETAQMSGDHWRVPGYTTDGLHGGYPQVYASLPVLILTPRDLTAPTLTSPLVTSHTDSTAALSVTTNEANGTLYYVITASATPPSAAQVKAGQNNGGTAAAASGNQAIASTGTKTANATGLADSTAYYAYFMHEDAVGNQSTVAAAATFTTDAPAYSAEALAIFAAFTTPPDTTRKNAIATCVNGLISDGVWTLVDALQVYAAADSQAARVDWRAPSRVATLTNAPTHATDRGFTTNGTSNYIDTLFNPTSGTPAYVQNSAFFSVWSRTTGSITTSGCGWFDGVDGVTLNIRNTSSISYRLNSAGSQATTTPAISDGIGFFSINRDTSATTQSYRNGSAVTPSGTAASTVLNNHTLLVGAITAASFQAREWAAMAAGGSMTSTQHLALYNRLQTYMTAVGA